MTPSALLHGACLSGANRKTDNHATTNRTMSYADVVFQFATSPEVPQ